MDPVQRAYDNAILEIKSNTKLSSAEIERIITKTETNLRENLLHNSAQRDANELLRKFLNLITEEIIAKLYIFNDFPNFTKQLLIDLNILLPFTDLFIKKSEYTKCLTNPIEKNNYHEEYNYSLNIFCKIKDIDEDGSLVYNDFEINLNDIRQKSEFSGTDPNNAEACKWDNSTYPKREIPTINTEYFTEIEPQKYIIINLNRFEAGTKINNPINNLNLDNDNYIFDRYNNKYKLIGCICHTGSFNGGHYWYLHKFNNWKVYNDSSPIQHNTYINSGWADTTSPTKNIYTLLFKRVIFETCIPLYNIPLINQTILYNLSIYNLNIDINFIPQYFKLLTYYSNNKNNLQLDKEFDELFKKTIYSIRDQIVNKLR